MFRVSIHPVRAYFRPAAIQRAVTSIIRGLGATSANLVSWQQISRNRKVGHSKRGRVLFSCTADRSDHTRHRYCRPALPPLPGTVQRYRLKETSCSSLWGRYPLAFVSLALEVVSGSTCVETANKDTGIWRLIIIVLDIVVLGIDWDIDGGLDTPELVIVIAWFD